MSGMISAFLYLIAFSLEMWWIVEAKVALSVPAYVLASGYLLMFTMSLVMLMALRTRMTRFLVVWVLLNIVYIFPEAGLVLFMSIYHWNGKTYGVIELGLWAFRVAFNVFGIVSVQSLWSYWKDEKSIFRSLQELGNTNSGLVSNGIGDNSLGIPGQLKLRGSLRYTGGMNGYPAIPPGYNANYQTAELGYSNPAFSGSKSKVNGGLALTKYEYSTKDLHRVPSSASGFVSASRLQSFSQGYSGTEFNPRSYSQSQVDLRSYSRSAADLPSFGLDPDGPLYLQAPYGPGGLPVNIYRGNSRRDKILSEHERMEWYRPRSLGNIPVDMDSISLYSAQYDDRGGYEDRTFGFDRKYRAASMGNLHLSTGGSDWREREPIGTNGWREREPIGTSNGWREPIGSKQSLGQISGVSDNPERYRDIAL